MAKRRRRANKTAGKASKSSKKGMPAWIKPTFSMIIGGGVGLVAMSLLPSAIAPFAPALGVLGSKIFGGGGWGKYAATAGVVAGVTFLSQRKTVQVAAGALSAAKRALTNGSSSGGGDAADQGAEILRRAGVGR